MKLEAEIMSSSAVPATNWWACYANDCEAFEKSQEIEMRMGKPTYKGTYFYCRVICWTVDSYWDRTDKSDAIQCIYGHVVGGPDINKASEANNFSHYVYSEKDLSGVTELVR